MFLISRKVGARSQPERARAPYLKNKNTGSFSHFSRRFSRRFSRFQDAKVPSRIGRRARSVSGAV